ncbi:MAG: M23 family metallopeptidase [Butyrivibrio sp.]|nr:M23 family metallopeptidase [Butyrivibrio sp.]
MLFTNTVFRKKIKIWFLQSALVVIAVWILFMPTFAGFERGEDNIFSIKMNGSVVGMASSIEDAQDAYRGARRRIARGNDELVLLNADMEIEGDNVLFGEVDSVSSLSREMERVLRNNEKSTLNRAYSIKINEFSINLATTSDVMELLSTALGNYDENRLYDVNLVVDTEREVNVLTPVVQSKEEVRKEEEIAEKSSMPQSGFQAELTQIVNDAKPIAYDRDFSDYELGLMSMDFADKVEIVESYLPDSEISDVASAIDEVTKDKETNQIYEVQAGDTLSTIALRFGLSVDDLVSMNENLEDANTTIRVQDNLIVTVPEPELSVSYKVQEYYEEDYEAEVQYVYNDTWYTTQTKVIQEPSAGHRKVVALVSYTDGSEEGREIVKEEISYMAVPKIIEKGTIVPPTYIKPISGGRLTSGFGKRSRPTKGASTYHKGVDWATPVGTSVVASSSGTVTRAGWGSGYGYCVYIRHPDGRETRYGHLSKVLVSVGQSVSQGQRIALSGNTGVSTGPHLHFEILVNGSQVNPLSYLN